MFPFPKYEIIGIDPVDARTMQVISNQNKFRLWRSKVLVQSKRWRPKWVYSYDVYLYITLLMSVHLNAKVYLSMLFDLPIVDFLAIWVPTQYFSDIKCNLSLSHLTFEEVCLIYLLTDSSHKVLFHLSPNVLFFSVLLYSFHFYGYHYLSMMVLKWRWRDTEGVVMIDRYIKWPFYTLAMKWRGVGFLNSYPIG